MDQRRGEGPIWLFRCVRYSSHNNMILYYVLYCWCWSKNTDWQHQKLSRKGIFLLATKTILQIHVVAYSQASTSLFLVSPMEFNPPGCYQGASKVPWCHLCKKNLLLGVTYRKCNPACCKSAVRYKEAPADLKRDNRSGWFHVQDKLTRRYIHYCFPDTLHTGKEPKWNTARGPTHWYGGGG